MLIEAGLPCEKCGSSDAVAKYQDGSYCFSCGNYCKKSNSSWARSPRANMFCPREITIEHKDKAYMYLVQRHFTDEQIYYYDIKQDTLGTALIFSYYENCQCLFKEMKRIDGNGVKCLSFGSKEVPFQGLYGIAAASTWSNYLIIVEDILSAMRVGWLAPCIALRGTKLSQYSLSMLIEAKKQNTALKVVLWLDGDKPGQESAESIKKVFDVFGINCLNTCSPKDPKMYTDEQINEIIEAYHDL